METKTLMVWLVGAVIWIVAIVLWVRIVRGRRRERGEYEVTLRSFLHFCTDCLHRASPYGCLVFPEIEYTDFVTGVPREARRRPGNCYGHNKHGTCKQYVKREGEIGLDPVIHIGLDGDQWIARIGEDLQQGIVGIGRTEGLAREACLLALKEKEKARA